MNVNCIAPGTIHTGKNTPPDSVIKQIPLGRAGTIEDCAKVVEFLATDLSDYVSGKIITVDGEKYEHR